MNKDNKTSDKQENGNDFIADVSISSLQSILRERITNEAFSLTNLDFNKEYNLFFDKMNENLDGVYKQIQSRFYNEFSGQFNDNFKVRELSMEGCKYSTELKLKKAYIDGFEAARTELNWALERQKSLIIDAIEQAFTLSNAIRSN